MKSSCIPHPEREPLIVVRKWQLEATGGNKAGAALLSFFEYWHNVKLDQAEKSQQKNNWQIAPGEEVPPKEDESLLQYHTLSQLEEGTLLFKRDSLRTGIEKLVELGFVTVHENPNPAYAYDNTKHFFFRPEAVIAWLKSRERSWENQRGSWENQRGSWENQRTSTETTTETTNNISNGGHAHPQADSPDESNLSLPAEMNQTPTASLATSGEPPEKTAPKRDLRDAPEQEGLFEAPKKGGSLVHDLVTETVARCEQVDFFPNARQKTSWGKGYKKLLQTEDVSVAYKAMAQILGAATYKDGFFKSVEKALEQMGYGRNQKEPDGTRTEKQRQRDKFDGMTRNSPRMKVKEDEISLIIDELTEKERRKVVWNAEAT